MASRASSRAERGFVVGAHRARITFQPFRALAASATMLGHLGRVHALLRDPPLRAVLARCVAIADPAAVNM